MAVRRRHPDLLEGERDGGVGAFRWGRIVTAPVDARGQEGRGAARARAGAGNASVRGLARLAADARWDARGQPWSRRLADSISARRSYSEVAERCDQARCGSRLHCDGTQGPSISALSYQQARTAETICDTAHAQLGAAQRAQRPGGRRAGRRPTQQRAPVRRTPIRARTRRVRALPSARASGGRAAIRVRAPGGRAPLSGGLARTSPGRPAPSARARRARASQQHGRVQFHPRQQQTIQIFIMAKGIGF